MMLKMLKKPVCYIIANPNGFVSLSHFVRHKMTLLTVSTKQLSNTVNWGRIMFCAAI